MVLCLSELPRTNVECHSNQYSYYNFSNGISSFDSESYPVKYCTPSSIYWFIITNYTLNPFPQGYISIYDLTFENWTIMIELMKELDVISYASKLLRILQKKVECLWAIFVLIITLVYDIWPFPKFITNESLSAADISLNLSYIYLIWVVITWTISCCLRKVNLAERILSYFDDIYMLQHFSRMSILL